MKSFEEIQKIRERQENYVRIISWLLAFVIAILIFITVFTLFREEVKAENNGSDVKQMMNQINNLPKKLANEKVATEAVAINFEDENDFYHEIEKFFTNDSNGGAAIVFPRKMFSDQLWNKISVLVDNKKSLTMKFILEQGQQLVLFQRKK